MKVLEQALLWLDADTTRFWILAWGTFCLCALQCLRPVGGSAAPQPRWSLLLFAVSVAATMAAFRWPVWFYPLELNPDESQTVAGAITLARFPVYWKFVDGTTHGPWSEYLLLLAHWFGAPLNYVTARIITGLLGAGTLLAAWGTLRCFTGETIARTAILPALAFWSFTTWDDFVHYSSELPAIFLLAVAGWLGAVLLTAPRWSRRHVLLAGLTGFFLGNLVFAKLQSVPLGVALGGVLLWFLWRNNGREDAALRNRLMAALVLGALVPALIAAVFITLFGLWGHFVPAYLLSALAYVNLRQHPLAVMPMRFFRFSATEPAFAWFFWGSLGFALLYLRTPGAERRLRAGMIVGWVLLAVAAFCVLRPGREVVHYLQFFLLPLTLLLGFTLAAAAKESEAQKSPPVFPGRLLLLLLLFTVFPQIYHRIVTWHRFAGHVQNYLNHTPSKAAQFIQKHRQPGETIAMWGWDSHLLVETGMPHGTRESHTASQLTEWPLRHYFTERYLWDMERRQPAWFVDVVGPGAFIYNDRGAWAHETVLELRQRVATDFELMAEFDHTRIYRRKSVIAR
jgi:hypothetical protein